MNVSTIPPNWLPDSVFRSSLYGIVLCRPVYDTDEHIIDFQVVRCNDRAVSMVGLSREIMLTRSMLTVDPDGHRSGIFERYRRVIESGLPMYVEHYFADADVWMAQSLARSGDNDVLATWTDITRQKQAELANQQQVGLLRSVLDNSRNSIVAFSAVRDEATGEVVDFRYVAQNEVNRRYLNRTDEEVIGQTMMRHCPVEIQTSVFDRFVRVIETGHSDRFEQEYNYNERIGWSEISVAKWDDGIVLTIIDITRSKAQQQQIEQGNRDLQRLSDNLRQFAYVASHDLQEPLRKIMAFSDILQEQFAPQLGDFGQDVIGRMQSATGRMSALIRDVLAYSRISTHREPFQLVSLDQVLADVCRELRADFGEAEGQIDADALPIIQGDLAQLHHLLANLLENALKFRSNAQSAIIRVTCRTVSGAAAPPELNPATVYYEISLTDNGIGFDMKYADRIFEVFQRLHTRQQYSGTGIGLAICKRVVENHQGAIRAASQPGHGATFRVYLPK